MIIKHLFTFNIIKRMNKTINERLAAIIDKLGINKSEFSKQIDVANPVIYNIIRGRNKPSYDLIEKIVSTFNVNPNYLILGTGEMFLNANKQMIEYSDKEFPFINLLSQDLLDKTLKSIDSGVLLEKLIKLCHVDESNHSKFSNSYLHITIINDILQNYRLDNAMKKDIEGYLEKGSIDFKKLKQTFQAKAKIEGDLYQLIQPLEKTIEKLYEIVLKFDQENNDIYA